MADIGCLDPSNAGSADVKNREYILTDCKNQRIGSARPGYAAGEDPDAVGWPICRLPRVDHAHVSAGEAAYILTMHSSKHYSLITQDHQEVLRIMHKGIAGGWTVDAHGDFAPEILCGIFTFCRYIERENEFLIV